MTLEDDLLAVASRLGFAQPLLSAYATVSGDLHVPDVDDRIREFTLADQTCRGEILVPLIPGYASWAYRACIIAHAFRTRGYRPILLVDAGDFDISPAATVDETYAKSVELSRFYQRKIPHLFGMETLSVGDALPSSWSLPEGNILDDAGCYRGLDLERYAISSTRKYLKRYTLDQSDASVSDTFDAFLRSSIRLADACHHLVETRDVEAVIVNEPAYVQGGIPADTAHEHDVPGYSQMLGYRDESILFGRVENRSTQPQFTDREVVGSALSTPLGAEERDEIDRIMEGRKTGDTSAIQYSSGTNRSVDVSDDKLLVGMFTNLLWDASLIPDEAPYPNVYDWVDDTIEGFRELDGAHLVVKLHPAEAKFGTEESLGEWQRIPTRDCHRT
ncbi:hypothetical protein ACFQJD_08380 [Haloplanus sp. GCM10025708]|uniref:hypothetical protein n=1 Tax=Haloplanus sp. GCM10025708 TaxID=3252679 RepID=UPI0036168CA3